MMLVRSAGGASVSCVISWLSRRKSDGLSKTSKVERSGKRFFADFVNSIKFPEKNHTFSAFWL